MLDGLTLQMATDALTLSLPGTSVQVFVRCLQIPNLVIVNKFVFERSGIGPQQEGGGGFQKARLLDFTYTYLKRLQFTKLLNLKP